MLRLLVSILLSGVIAATGGVGAVAKGLSDSLDFSGLLESELAFGSSSEDVQKAEFVLTPQIAFDLTDTMRFTMIVRLRGDMADELVPGRPRQQTRSDFTGRLVAGDNVDLELREAYIDTEIGQAFLRVGKQQVVWGQADGLKVLDVLNPQSFREFILDDFEDSRIPLWSVNVEFPVGEAFVQIVWIPDTTYDDVLQPGSAFSFTSPLIVPATPPGIPVTFLPLDRPDDPLVDSDAGVQLSALLGGWDLTFNYAWHYFDKPVVRREITGTSGHVSLGYERTHLMGGTFSNVFGDFILRGEVGLSSDRFFLTTNTTDSDGVIASSEIAYVLGIDYQGWSDWFISGQMFQSIIADPALGLVRDEVDTTATLLVRRDFMNEALQAEALLIQSLNQGDGVLQASLDYEWRSNVRLKVGADVFHGDPEGLFGQFGENDRVTFGAEVGF